MPRKLFLHLLLIVISPLSVFSAPGYGTKLPQRGKFFAGIQNHLLFDRNLEDELGSVRSTQSFLNISYGLFDWLAIDLKGGAGNVKQHPAGSDEVDYPSRFAGGYGFRVKFWDRDRLKAVFGFQHISVHPRYIHLNDVKNKAILDDWQTSLIVSCDFRQFTPYLGAKFSRVDYIHWVEDDRKRRMSDLTETIGLVLGLDLPLTENTWINLEGHLFDGESLATSFNFSF